jgi:acyl transferase domain-containing protein
VIGFVRDALSAGEGGLAQELPSTPVSQVSTPKEAVPESTRIEPAPYQGLLFLSGDDRGQLKQSLIDVLSQARSGTIPPSICPTVEQVGRAERLAIDYSDPAEFIKRCEKALSAMETDAPNAWQALQAQGIYRGSGQHGSVVFMFPGQGSQYVNMLRDLYISEPVVKDTFDEADRVMTPILGRTLTSYIYVEGDEAALAQA